MIDWSNKACKHCNDSGEITDDCGHYARCDKCSGRTQYKSLDKQTVKDSCVIDWSNIEDVTALVEEWETEIAEWLKEFGISAEIEEIFISNKCLQLVFSDDIEPPLLVTQTVLRDKIEQWSTEEIDDIENGWRMGQ